MKIQILGTGCLKCRKLAEVAETAARDIGADYTLEKVTDLRRIAEFRVLFPPALVVDGVVKVAGRVPSLEETRTLLSGLAAASR